MKIYHISTVHNRYDGRINKECISLLKAGFYRKLIKIFGIFSLFSANFFHQ